MPRTTVTLSACAVSTATRSRDATRMRTRRRRLCTARTRTTTRFQRVVRATDVENKALNEKTYSNVVIATTYAWCMHRTRAVHSRVTGEREAYWFFFPSTLAAAAADVPHSRSPTRSPSARHPTDTRDHTVVCTTAVPADGNRRSVRSGPSGRTVLLPRFSADHVACPGGTRPCATDDREKCGRGHVPSLNGRAPDGTQRCSRSDGDTDRSRRPRDGTQRLRGRRVHVLLLPHVLRERYITRILYHVRIS